MSTPRLLLFGSPNAGKSSLLGALAQAADGQLVEESGDLARLQKNTYEGKSNPTGELESYVLRFHATAAKGAEAVAEQLTVFDCSGASALEMLKAEEPFARPHPMKKPVLDADAVLLALD